MLEQAPRNWLTVERCPIVAFVLTIPTLAVSDWQVKVNLILDPLITHFTAEALKAA